MFVNVAPRERNLGAQDIGKSSACSCDGYGYRELGAETIETEDQNRAALFVRGWCFEVDLTLLSCTVVEVVPCAVMWSTSQITRVHGTKTMSYKDPQ